MTYMYVRCDVGVAKNVTCKQTLSAQARQLHVLTLIALVLQVYLVSSVPAIPWFQIPPMVPTAAACITDLAPTLVSCLPTFTALVPGPCCALCFVALTPCPCCALCFVDVVHCPGHLPWFPARVRRLDPLPLFADLIPCPDSRPIFRGTR